MFKPLTIIGKRSLYTLVPISVESTLVSSYNSYVLKYKLGAFSDVCLNIAIDPLFKIPYPVIAYSLEPNV